MKRDREPGVFKSCWEAIETLLIAFFFCGILGYGMFAVTEFIRSLLR
jgi:hypothetical protein